MEWLIDFNILLVLPLFISLINVDQEKSSNAIQHNVVKVHFMFCKTYEYKDSFCGNEKCLKEII